MAPLTNIFAESKRGGVGGRKRRSFHCSQAISDKEGRGGAVLRKDTLLKPTLIVGSALFMVQTQSFPAGTFTSNVTSGVLQEAMGTPPVPARGSWSVTAVAV